jgi:hypothetical protein
VFNYLCIVQVEEVQAKMENGVLTVTFPKTAADQQPKRVNIAWKIWRFSALISFVGAMYHFVTALQL